MEEFIKKIVIDSIRQTDFSVPSSFSIDVPPKVEFGDFATNVALVIGGREKTNPKDIAQKLTKIIEKEKNIKKVEIAGPGFINLFLTTSFYKQEIEKILKLKEDYGRGNQKQTKIQVEYISANPTGPLHIGNARGGPIGETIANLFSFLGYQTEREFYINDLGGQVDRFAETLFYWYAKKNDPGASFPEDGYPGKDLKEISEKIQKNNQEEISELKDKHELLSIFKREGLYYTIKNIREDSLLLDIKFDNWISQSDFEHNEKTDQVVSELEQRGSTVNKEGALWFKDPNDPELEDRESVLRKSDAKKSYTYFADDIAYHKDKYERGFKKVINVWGANHFGHVPRLKAALKALGYSEERLKIVLYQYVRLKNSGKVVSMGKRFGSYITLRQVIESGVAPDAFKYFILAQNPNTPFDFDIKLATDTTEKNPVFYIKYAYARICSILKKYDSKGEPGEVVSKCDISLLKNSKEEALYKELVRFPGLINSVSTNFQIQTLPHYAYKIATLFHDFYANCQVISSDKKLEAARLSLVVATKYVLANTLKICSIEAPEKM